MAMEGDSLYIPRWFLHRRDVKTATKWSLAEARPKGTPKTFIFSKCLKMRFLHRRDKNTDFDFAQ
jgi:hypothetical protein